MNRTIFLILIAIIGALLSGCLSKQVAEKARTADELVDGVQQSLNAIIEFDAEAKADSDAIKAELSEALNMLSAAIQAGKWALVAEVHYRLLEIERRSALVIEQAKVRSKALREAKERADKAKAAASAAADLAEANAAQYQAFAGIGQAIVSGVTGGHSPINIPGSDYTGEVVTGITALIISLIGVQGGKRIFKKQTIITPPPPYQYGPRRGPLAPPNIAAAAASGISANVAANGSVNGSNGAFPDNVDPALMATWKASQEENH